MFQHWRRPVDASQKKRDSIAFWLLQEEGADILKRIPEHSLVLIYDSPNSDVVHHSAKISRPDLLFHRISIGGIKKSTQDVMGNYSSVYMLMTNDVRYPCAVDGAMRVEESIRKAESVCLWKVSGNQ